MSDVKAIRHLLISHAPLTAVVPVARIVAGNLPVGCSIPAVSIAHISGVPGSEISQQSPDKTARVQVTVKAANYPQQKQLIDLVCAAVPRTRGLIAGVQVESILRGSDGPDFSDDELQIYMQTQDFLVKYSQ